MQAVYNRHAEPRERQKTYKKSALSGPPKSFPTSSGLLCGSASASVSLGSSSSSFSPSGAVLLPPPPMTVFLRLPGARWRCGVLPRAPGGLPGLDGFPHAVLARGRRSERSPLVTCPTKVGPTQLGGCRVAGWSAGSSRAAALSAGRMKASRSKVAVRPTRSDASPRPRARGGWRADA